MRRYIVAVRELSGLGLGGGPIGEALLANLTLLGGGELGRVLALDQLDRAAGLFDRFARAFRRAGDLEHQLALDLALAKQANTVPAAASEASGLERGVIERALGV